jgi:hypothetical protein
MTRWVLVTLIVSAATPAFAQYYGPDDRYGPVIETVDQSETRPAGTYVVREGDTLWGLSEQAFGDGGFWPSLWSFNPQVTNPHWIYPGDLLYLRPQNQSRTEARVTYARSRFSESPRLEEIRARFKGFITERQYRESGRIAHSREERQLLGKYDEAYLEFNIPKRILPGEEYTIYRPFKQILHPTTGEPVGWMIQHLGVARVLNVDRERPYIKSLILSSYEEIRRGDLLTQRVWNDEVVVPVENRVGLWSRILDSFRDVNEFGEHDYVIIDRGFHQKIRRGNRLILRWRGDGVNSVPTEEAERFPWENHGEVMVIEPFENTSLAIVLRSMRETHRGDLLEMVRGY